MVPIIGIILITDDVLVDDLLGLNLRMTLLSMETANPPLAPALVFVFTFFVTSEQLAYLEIAPAMLLH